MNGSANQCGFGQVIGLNDSFWASAFICKMWVLLRSWRFLLLWNVLLVHSVTVQSLQHFYLLPADVGNVVEETVIPGMKLGKRNGFWKLSELSSAKVVFFGLSGVVASVCIHFIWKLLNQFCFLFFGSFKVWKESFELRTLTFSKLIYVRSKPIFKKLLYCFYSSVISRNQSQAEFRIKS